MEGDVGYYEAPGEFPRQYIGLDDQGVTDYLNVLVQALYMTPEFCAKIYSWKYEPARDGEPESA